MKRGRLMFFALGIAIACVIMFMPGCQTSSKPKSNNGGNDSGNNVIARTSYGYNDYDIPLETENSSASDDVTQVTFTREGGDYDADVNPMDPTMIVFCSTRFSKNPQIFITQIGKKSVIQKTFDTKHSYIQPKFSPDGKRIAFASNRSGTSWDIYEIDAVGKSAMTCVTSDLRISDEFHPTYSPSEFNKIAFSVSNGKWSIGVKDRLTGEMTYLSTEGLYPEWSPDGTKIAYQKARKRGTRWFHIGAIQLEMKEEADRSGNARTVKRMVDGKEEDLKVYKLIVGDEIILVESNDWGAINPSWSPDSKRIAFASVHLSDDAIKEGRKLRGDDLWVVDLENGVPETITEDSAADWNPSWASKDSIIFSSDRKGQNNLFKIIPKLSVR